MALYKVTVDGNEYIVESSERVLRKRMLTHIRQEREKGKELAQIVFCWGRVTPLNWRR